MRPARIADAFRAACAEEVAALKPGNVHVHAPGHGMSVPDFLLSAEAATPALCAKGTGLGARVLGAVQATRAAVGQNTNLGILLLCAPLAMAAEEGGDLREGVRRAVAGAGVDEAGLVFQAIVLAAPGGLGESPRHDVREPATVPLLAAMAEAAPRDRVARQYVNGFADVFGDGLGAYGAALARWGDPPWAAVAAYLRHMAAGPDSHVLRKQGSVVVAEVQEEAAAMEALFLNQDNPAILVPRLLDWDAALKRRGVNPGTCADLTVATAMAWRLQKILRSPDEDD